jgi:hypothetical protein
MELVRLTLTKDVSAEIYAKMQPKNLSGEQKIRRRTTPLDFPRNYCKNPIV